MVSRWAVAVLAVAAAALPAVASAQQPRERLVPVFDCVSPNAATGTSQAWYSVRNPNSTAVTIPINTPENMRSPASNRQSDDWPSVFQPGLETHAALFTFPSNLPSVWRLDGNEAFGDASPQNRCVGLFMLSRPPQKTSSTSVIFTWQLVASGTPQIATNGPYFDRSECALVTGSTAEGAAFVPCGDKTSTSYSNPTGGRYTFAVRGHVDGTQRYTSVKSYTFQVARNAPDVERRRKPEPKPTDPDAPQRPTGDVPAGRVRVLDPQTSAGPAADAPPPCRSRRVFRVRVKGRYELSDIVAGRAFLQGDFHRRLLPGRVVRGRLTARVDLRGIGKGKVQVRSWIKLRDGRIVTDVRTYRTCAGAPR
jgi:hypothetical protein